MSLKNSILAYRAVEFKGNRVGLLVIQAAQGKQSGIEKLVLVSSGPCLICPHLLGLGREHSSNCSSAVRWEKGFSVEHSTAESKRKPLFWKMSQADFG